MRRTFDFRYLALPQTHRRKRCNGDKKNPKAFSADNDMDPGDVPPQLEGMTQVGQMLIAKVAPIMRVYRLKGGQYAHDGYVVNIPQDVTGFTTSLPRLPADIPSSSCADKGQRRNRTKTSWRETTKPPKTRNIIVFVFFLRISDSSLQTPADTHTADGSYKYHRTRVRNDSYTIFYTAIRHRISPEFIGSRKCVPMAFIAESPPAQGQLPSR